MKANELRIGNLVRVNFGDIKDSVHSITGNDISYIASDKINKNKVIISPIKLTEEWFIKFGFEKKYPDGKDEFPWWVHHKGLELCDFLDGDYEINSTAYIINNVHQLQNLYFSSTGEELTIKE